jgi:predicted transposase YbfD/YdcC
VRRADDVQWNKGHGRVECREVWVVASQGLQRYLEQELGWSGVQLSGRIRRSRKHTGKEDWEEQKTHTWVSSLSPAQGTARRMAQLLRSHWTIENGVFRVRDVSYDEDRLHGRQIASALSTLRNVAINIIRYAGYPYIPDGWRDIACMPDHGLYLLDGRLTL